MSARTSGRFEDDVVISGLGQSAVGRRLGRSPLSLTMDAVVEAIADAGLSFGDIDGVVAYPGGGTSLGPGFAGPPIAEVYDALGIEPAFLLGAFEGPAQLGPIVNGGLAISGGLARHVVVYRTVTEGSARRVTRDGRVDRSGSDAGVVHRPRRGSRGHRFRPPRSSPLPRVRHDARTARPDRPDGTRACPAQPQGGAA